MYFTRNNVTISPHKDFYEVDIRKQAYIEDSYVPIFNQILDLEAIELYKITKLIEKHNGMVSYVNTDNAVGEFEYWDLHNFKAEATKHFWDKDNKVLKYKLETNFADKNRVERPNKEIYHYEKPKYKIIDDPKTNNFTEHVKKLIALGTGFQINGRGGTGKSTLCREIMKYFDANKISYVELAPTHKACRQLGKNAQTVHSF